MIRIKSAISQVTKPKIQKIKVPVLIKIHVRHWCSKYSFFLIPQNLHGTSIKIITKNTNALVFGEIMNPSWINPSWINPPITPAKEYRRDISSYDNLLEPYGFIRKKTEITIQEYWGLPYTIARWENAKIIQS